MQVRFSDGEGHELRFSDGPDLSISMIKVPIFVVRICRRNSYDAVDRLWPEMGRRSPGEHQRDVRIRDRVRGVVYSGDANLQRG